MLMMPELARTLRQRYAKCRAVSKEFNRLRPKMLLQGCGMSTTSKIICYVRGLLGVPKETGNVITPTGLILLPPKPEGLCRLFELAFVMAHFLEG
jgi:hypothetical protein